MRTRINSIVVLAMLLVFGCSNSKNTFAGSVTDAPSHDNWTKLLAKHVRSNGLVDYKGFIADKSDLNAYADFLSENPPAENWSDNEKIAYWINAYNVFTVKLIVDNYPVESIKDLNPRLSIPTVRSIWTKEWFQIGGEDFSLDRIEHKILRKDFEEPRIHFAVNCASISCPVLRNEAYTAEKLDAQLDEQARKFLNDTSRNKITPQRVEVSKIFSWFGGDFKKGQSLIQFLNKYSEVQIEEKAKVRFASYDWNLNDVK
ncbi:DUF547 domain-containing protein [Roseivirga sp. E12]|uniref:DUF547 domain-containing protein n=1 Tax=Roseivirga sp. E12 TaxID=2819237 RepID=UPI001ABCFE50|nr:DUF547 domain-containing protein [Roseivirga sp. E12]MBO3699684.1 DUF547 domain-containing protein [Roseivirga sp. E12]